MSCSIITDQGDLFSLENIYNAYLACRRKKQHTINALRFEVRLLDNLCALQRELRQRTYHPSTSICFIQKRPKMREIFAADFRDRVVHHLLVGYLEPIYERIFIHDSFACRRGKGVHGGVARLRAFLNRVTANGTIRAWYLKEDIRGFFMNLNKDILYSLLCRKSKRDAVRWLAARVIYHDCTEDYSFKGQRSLLELIAPHKSLFKVAAGTGLPIGNLTSQFFANVYLNELDQFVKRTLKCRYYIRYCDDFILLDRDRDRLKAHHGAIETFLRQKLRLALNPGQYRLRQVSSGIDFLGYIVRRRYTLVRRRVVNHCREKLTGFEQRLAGRERGQVVSRAYTPEEVTALRAVTSSYLGHFQWADSGRLVSSLFQRFPVLRANFILFQGRIIPRYELPYKKATIRKQYYWWLYMGLAYVNGTGKRMNPVLIFFKVGRFYEFYDPQAELAIDHLGLQPVTGLRGFKLGCGFHYRCLGKYLRRAWQLGFHTALIGEERVNDGRIRRRLMVLHRAGL